MKIIFFPSISGFWQVLEFDYRFKVVSHILNLIEEKSLPLDGIPRISTIKVLSELEPRPVITQCFDYYLKPTGVDTDDGKMLDLFLPFLGPL